MCVRVRLSASPVLPYDHTTRTITVPADLNRDFSLRAVRAVLAELGVEQPALGAVCWCGQPVHIETSALAQFNEVIHIGA